MTWKRSDVSRRSSWTKAEIRRARAIALRPVLEDLGYHFTELRNGNYLLHHLAAEIVVKDHFWICKDDGSAACPERSRGGNAIDFLVEVQGMSFSQAVELLLSYAEPACTTATEERHPRNYSSGQPRRTKKVQL